MNTNNKFPENVPRPLQLNINAINVKKFKSLHSNIADITKYFFFVLRLKIARDCISKAQMSSFFFFPIYIANFPRLLADFPETETT